VRARRLNDPADADALRFQKLVLESQAHLGILIEDDGQSCAVFDERGQLLPPSSLIPMFAALALSESTGGTVLVPEAADPAQAIHIGRLGGRCLMVRPTPATITRKLIEHHAVFAADGLGRYWFHDGSPSCDAILTLAKTLQALSRSDAEFSIVAGPPAT
ncbi:MAG TPA: hypothetical protein VHB77_23335, partial [Planctomycetaceae bacterium]|nr:hypothetical protein [Planctomycetaceae bacterium]